LVVEAGLSNREECDREVGYTVNDGKEGVAAGRVVKGCRDRATTGGGGGKVVSAVDLEKFGGVDRAEAFLGRGEMFGCSRVCSHG
jgi:hypothetical protein